MSGEVLPKPSTFSTAASAFILMPLECERSRIFDLKHLGKAELGLPTVGRLRPHFLLGNVLLVMRFFELTMELLPNLAEHTVSPGYERDSISRMRLSSRQKLCFNRENGGKSGTVLRTGSTDDTSSLKGCCLEP